MTKSPRKNVPDVGIEPGAACMPSELASDRATAPGYIHKKEGGSYYVVSTNESLISDPVMTRQRKHEETYCNFANFK